METLDFLKMRNIRFLGRCARISWKIMTAMARTNPDNPDWKGVKEMSASFIRHEYSLLEN